MSNDAHAPAAAPARKSKRGLLIVIVMLLAGGGGGAYWFFLKDSGKAQAAEAAEAEPEEPPATGIVPLEPFVVNLADPSGTRFLRVSLSLVVADEEHAKEFEHDKVGLMRVRSSILELLAQKQSAELMTPDGKSALKASIAEAVSKAVHEQKVSDVLFSEFIVQF